MQTLFIVDYCHYLQGRYRKWLRIEQIKINIRQDFPVGENVGGKKHNQKLERNKDANK